jgi:hypothetical protein
MQQASLSKLGLYGMPKFEKTFDYGSNNLSYVDSENYFSRILMIRKNYLNSSNFAPYLVKKHSNYNNKSFVNIIDNNEVNSIFKVYFLNYMFSNFFNVKHVIQKNNFILNNMDSGINKFGKSYFIPYYDQSSFYENYSLLTDIFIKREFLYRQLFFNLNYKSNINSFFLLNNNNNFFNELKSVYNFNKPTKFAINSINSFFFNKYNISYNYSTENLISKSQYKPLRRGISHMMRIQASNIIALPVELRIQLLASSRDIIHS